MTDQMRTSVHPRFVMLLYTAVTAIAAAGATASDTLPACGLRDDRVSLAGSWKFQLRYDNQLTVNGPVHFGPVSASSHAVVVHDPVNQDDSIIHSLPLPLLATLADWAPAGSYSSTNMIWKPHPRQEGPVWWQADLGGPNHVSQVHIQWAALGQVKVVGELSDDGATWRRWATAESTSDDRETRLVATPAQGRLIRLTFEPADFAGVTRMSVYLGEGKQPTQWLPRIQRSWFQELRRYTPADGFHTAAFDATAWDDIQVPGAWESQGFGKASWYTSDEAVGYYRRTFRVPDAWKDRPVRLRLEAVNNSAQVWINGREVGYHEGLTSFEFDAKPYLQFDSDNVIAVRAAKWSLTHEYETDDAYFLGGILRDIYLYALPPDGIEDFAVTTEFDPEYRNGILRASLDLRAADPKRGTPCEVEGTLFDAEGCEVPLENFRIKLTLAGSARQTVELASVVESPEKWTAETPYRYSLRFRLHVADGVVQEFHHQFGFRQVELRDNRLLVNGIPIKLRGVLTTRSNPCDSGEPLSTVYAREIRFLKEANINAIRSHTTPLEDAFLDLCDEYGIYVMPDVPYVWANEGDFHYLTDELVQRAQETYAQQRHHTSVILWHIGNENPNTTGFLGAGRAAKWLLENDPTRPTVVCIHGANPIELGTAISDYHYWPMRHGDVVNEGGAPVILGEYHGILQFDYRLHDLGFAETWGRSLQGEWGEIAKRPWVIGGMICGWDDGGVMGSAGDDQWGLLDSKRRPKSLYYQVAKVYAPVKLTLEDPVVSDSHLQAVLSVSNSFTYLNLKDLRFQWDLEHEERVLASGQVACAVEPGDRGKAPLALDVPARPDCLHITVFDPQGRPIVEERFDLPVAKTTRDIPELLAKIGLADHDTPIHPDGLEVQTEAYHAVFEPQGTLVVSDPADHLLLKVDGFTFLRDYNNGGFLIPRVTPRSVHLETPRNESNVVVVPFWVHEGRDDDISRKDITGTLRFAFGSTWIECSYALVPTHDAAFTLSGVNVYLGDTLRQLTWNRRPLWSVMPADLHDGALEQNVSLKDLRQRVSLRDVLWLEAGGAGGSVFVQPREREFFVHQGETDNGLVLGDFLGAYGFLGKYDVGTEEKKVTAGRTHEGSLTLHFLSDAQSKALHSLSTPEKDLNWAVESEN